MTHARYNVLYGLLVRTGKPDVESVFYKRHTKVAVTRRMRELLSLMVPAVLRSEDEAGRLPLFASAVCAAVLDTQFGNDIARLDPGNSYEPPRLSGGVAGRPRLYDLTGGLDDLRAMSRLLDADIAERLVAPQWMDYMAAGCLQLLREAS